MAGARFDFLRKLIDLVEEYEDNHAKPDLAHFTLWLTAKVFPATPDFTGTNANRVILNLPEGTLESNIARIVSNLFKYTKQYTKKALVHSPLLTLDEFGFLAYLFFKPAITKTELIRIHLMEIPSGTEVIKRLLKNDLLEDYQDEQDSRAKRVRITAKGREVMLAAFKEMSKVAQLVSGSLSQEERIQLLNLLMKLDDFHQELSAHTTSKNWHIDELLTYLPDKPNE